MNNKHNLQNTVFLGLGSNIGNKKENLEKALNLLKEKIIIEKISSTYESKPYGFQNQNDFYNIVIKGETSLTPESLLFFCKFVEEAFGRKVIFKNGPRIIDIDILLYNDELINTNDLVIPHPQLHERDFVLIPLLEIEPELKHPSTKKPLHNLVMNLKEKYIISKVT